MRVLHIVEATIAGVRTHVYSLVTGLDRRRFQSVVACPPCRQHSFGDDQFVSQLTQAGVPVVPVALRRAIDPLADLLALRQLVGIMRRERFDLVHLHSSKAGFLGRLAARMAGGPLSVYTPNGLYFLGLPPSPKRRFYLGLERLAARLGDCIVATSGGERDVLLRYGIAAPDRLVRIDNGIAPIALPDDYDRQARRAALGQAGAGPLIGTAARLTAQKNPALFLDAAAIVLRDCPDARFVWCGGGELAEAAWARARALEIDHACAFLGHRADVAGVMAALDVFWLTSNYEGMPYALLEALALRLPIVATDVVGSRDVVAGTAGLLVPPGDAPALARATLALARSPDRRAALGRAAYARFQERYTLDRMLRAVEHLYQDLAGGSRELAGQSPTIERA